MIWFGLVWFYGFSITVGHLTPNPFNTFISNKYDLVWFGLVRFYGFSITVGHLTPNPFNTFISNKYDLVWFGLVLWLFNHCRSFNTKSFKYIYIK